MNLQMPDNHPKDTVRAFIIENLFLGSESEFGDDDSLTDAAALDSTAAVEIVAFLEETFGIEIEDHEINPNNLDTLNRIAALIERKTASLAK